MIFSSQIMNFDSDGSILQPWETAAVLILILAILLIYLNKIPELLEASVQVRQGVVICSYAVLADE